MGLRIIKMDKIYKTKKIDKEMIKGTLMSFLVLLFVIGFVSAAVVPTDGLVAHYNFLMMVQVLF